jgi:adenylosuccinate lyase
MIERYSTDIQKFWTDEYKFKEMTRLELIYLSHLLNKDDEYVNYYMDLLWREGYSGEECVSEIRAKEKETKHETAALVSWLSDQLSEEDAPHVHFNLTSSDILDTVYSKQMLKSKIAIHNSLSSLTDLLYQETLNDKNKVKFIGRTHGKWAQERKLNNFFHEHYCEFYDVCKRLDGIYLAYAKLSGPVGENRFENSNLSWSVLKSFFGFSPLTPATTQVIPRHLYIPFFNNLKDIANAIERLATNIRNLSRSEIGEFNEGFSDGQIGSSAMPHKKNPILCENLCGVTRVIRGYNSILDQSTCLWNERDMSHSSVERIVVPDIINLTDFSISRMSEVVKNLYIDYDRIEENRKSAEIESKSVEKLNTLIKSGMSRSDAYKQVQNEYKGS